MFAYYLVFGKSFKCKKDSRPLSTWGSAPVIHPLQPANKKTTGRNTHQHVAASFSYSNLLWYPVLRVFTRINGFAGSTTPLHSKFGAETKNCNLRVYSRRVSIRPKLNLIAVYRRTATTSSTQSGNEVSEHIAKVGSCLASVTFVLCYVNMDALVGGERMSVNLNITI